MKVPVMPPQPCTPTTSRVSSTPKRYFRVIAKAHTTPATSPVTSAPTGEISPQAGVMATIPATAPEQTPVMVTWPARHFSTIGQVISAPAAPSWVLIRAVAAAP